jgi:hypothetical protein
MKPARQFSGSAADQLRALYGFMSEQDFVASRRELIAMGFSDSRIKNWVRSGRLITIVRSVYSYGLDVRDRNAVWRAALLVAGPDSALTARSACESLGIVKSKPGLPQVVEVGSPSGQARLIKGLSPAMRDTTVTVMRRDFEPCDLTTSTGFTVARAALALTDYAVDASTRDVRFAFLEACRLGRFSKADLEYCYTRLAHRRGIRKLRPFLRLWVPELGRTRSAYEGWFLLMWIDLGYPVPKVNAKVFGVEVDLFFPKHRFALELDGDAFHSDPAQRRIDLVKQQRLESQGLRVERLPYRVFERDPVGEVNRIARELGFI